MIKSNTIFSFATVESSDPLEIHWMKLYSPVLHFTTQSFSQCYFLHALLSTFHYVPCCISIASLEPVLIVSTSRALLHRIWLLQYPFKSAYSWGKNVSCCIAIRSLEPNLFVFTAHFSTVPDSFNIYWKSSVSIWLCSRTWILSNEPCRLKFKMSVSHLLPSN